MARIITKELAEKIRDKLCTEPPRTTGGHDVYVVRHRGIVVGQISIRRASEKDKGHDYIPPALNITPHFAKEIGICNKNLADYVDCLRNKGLLPPEVLPDTEPLELKKPWERDWVAIQAAETPKPEES